MGFEYVSVKEAIGRDGRRMVVVGGVPSPWGEAAKGLFHIEGIDCGRASSRMHPPIDSQFESNTQKEPS